MSSAPSSVYGAFELVAAVATRAGCCRCSDRSGVSVSTSCAASIS
jgi:hypothetical protein